MSENQERIQEILVESKISDDEACQLLSALEIGRSTSEGTSESQTKEKMKSKYLHVHMVSGSEHEDSHEGEHVNVRVPMALIHAGMKSTSLLPSKARDKFTGALHEKGIDFDMRNLKPEDMDEFMEALSELEVDVVNNDGDTVEVYIE